MATVEKHCKLGLFLIWNMASALTVNDPHRELGKGVLVNWLFGKKKKEGWFVTLVHTLTLAHFQLPRLTCLPKSWMFNTPPSGTGTRSSSPPLAKKQISTCHSQASCKKKKKKKKNIGLILPLITCVLLGKALLFPNIALSFEKQEFRLCHVASLPSSHHSSLRSTSSVSCAMLGLRDSAPVAWAD